MSLVAVFCAEKLNIIRAETARDLLKNIVNSIEKLPKWNGNLYNWYDPRTLSVLPPAYVSSVDEGNFLCSLLLVRSITDLETSAKIDEIVARTDLGALYDPDRGLMRIGVETQSGRFDGHYDLLASESEILYLVGAGTGKIPRSAWEKSFAAKGDGVRKNRLRVMDGRSVRVPDDAAVFRLRKGNRVV